jgi:hypothetical protein
VSHGSHFFGSVGGLHAAGVAVVAAHIVPVAAMSESVFFIVPSGQHHKSSSRWSTFPPLQVEY